MSTSKSVESSSDDDVRDIFSLVDTAAKYNQICDEFTTCTSVACEAVSKLPCSTQIEILCQIVSHYFKNRSETRKLLICKIFDATVGHLQGIDLVGSDKNDIKISKSILEYLTEKQRQTLTRAKLGFSVHYIKFVQLNKSRILLKYKRYFQNKEVNTYTVIINGTDVIVLEIITTDDIVRSKLSTEVLQMLEFHKITRENGCRCLSVEQSPVKGYNVRYVQDHLFSQSILYSVDITDTELKQIRKTLVTELDE
jgi:hypothetical protein